LKNVQAGETGARRIHVAAGQIDLSDVSARVLFPTLQQGPWLPFERFAETIATARKKVGLHDHKEEEVVVYVLEGSVDHEDGQGLHTALGKNSILLLTAKGELHHELGMQKGRVARWISIVLRLNPGAAPLPTSTQVGVVPKTAPAADGTTTRRLVGPGSLVTSPTGLELDDVEFSQSGTCFCRVGRDRQCVTYVLKGTGKIDDQRVEQGVGALLENVSGVSFTGTPGFRVLLATAPRWRS
jgi:quercetin 2,3-dioxygenase